MPDEIVRFLTVDSLPYAYRVLRQPSPQTHPIVLLGGVFQGMYDWLPMEEALLPMADLVTLGSAGGSTTAPATPLPTALLCRAVEQVVDDLGTEQINLFGYSYGSVIAYQYALHHPERVARLMIGGVPAGMPQERRLRIKQRVAMFPAGQEQELASLLTESMLCMDPALPVLHRKLVYRYVRRTFLRHLRIIPNARDVLQMSLKAECAVTADGLNGVPTLVFGGAHDTVTTVADQRAFAATIEGSSFAVLESSDHWVLLERSAAVAELALRHFTGRLTPSAQHSVPAPAGKREAE
jgi:pimeloyl-ACP methyl ester carboxylesterase